MRFVPLSLLLVLSSSVFCQTWNNRYSDDEENTAISCRNIERVGDGYLLLLSEQLVFQIENISYYTWNLGSYKIGDDGQLQSTKYFNDSTCTTGLGWANESTIDSDGNVWACGFYNRFDDTDSLMGRLMKFSPEGDTLWTKLYGDTIHDHGLYAVRTTQDGNLIVQGMAVFNDTYSDNWVMKLDTSGNVIWSSYFGPGTKYRLSIAVAESADQQHFLISGYEDIEDYEPAPKIWVLYANGYYIGSRNYQVGQFNNSTAEGLTADAEGNFYWCGSIVHELSGNNSKGRHLIVKINSDLDTLWTREIGPDYLMYNFQTHTIIPTNDGNYLCVGTTGRYQEYDSNSQGFMAKFSPEGTVFWTRYFEAIPEAENLFYDVALAPDGGYVAAGETLSLNPEDERFTEKDAWVVKTDAFGCIVPGCQVGILEQDEIASFLLYPNPTEGKTNLYIQSHDPGIKSEIVVEDMSGREIRRHSTYGGNVNIVLDLSQLSTGMYLVRFLVEGQPAKTEKLMIK